MRSGVRHFTEIRSGEFAISSYADCMVSTMLVPVSPSGTGNTLRELTSCWFVRSHVSPASTRVFDPRPLIGFSRVSESINCSWMVVFGSVSIFLLIYFTYSQALDVHINLAYW